MSSERNEENDMTSVTTKRAIRIEKKKKKMAAFLEISRLNEFDRNTKKFARKLETPPEDLQVIETEPTPKRLRTEAEAEVTVHETAGYVLYYILEAM